MINALHSSQVGGPKNFTSEGQSFEWQAIVDMFERECQRVRDGNARMIPKLHEAHIIRDSWIKLNVTPAKIMQVTNMPVGGKLDATNYPISRAAQLIKQTVSAHHSGSCYRNLSLDTCGNDIHLERKKYGKNSVQ